MLVQMLEVQMLEVDLNLGAKSPSVAILVLPLVQLEFSPRVLLSCLRSEEWTLLCPSLGTPLQQCDPGLCLLLGQLDRTSLEHERP